MQYELEISHQFTKYLSNLHLWFGCTHVILTDKYRKYSQMDTKKKSIKIADKVSIINKTAL